MELLIEGQEYRLEYYPDKDESIVVKFIGRDHLGNVTSGTTNEQVVNMLIDRLYVLQKRKFSIENSICIKLLKMVKSQLKSRKIKVYEQREHFKGKDFRFGENQATDEDY